VDTLQKRQVPEAALRSIEFSSRALGAGRGFVIGSPGAAFRDGRAVAAFLISVAGGKIRHVFMQTDPERLGHVGPLN
jgi:hypothetical protein